MRILFLILFYCKLSGTRSGEWFYNTLDYGIVQSTKQHLRTMCTDIHTNNIHTDKMAQCTPSYDFCILQNVVLHNRVFSTPCPILVDSPRNTGYNSWDTELKRSVIRKNVCCGHYTNRLDTVILIKPDILDNIYHHIDTLLNAYISYLIALQQQYSDITIVLYDTSHDLSTHRFGDLWRIFRNVKSLRDIGYTQGVCITRLYLGLPTRRINSLMYNAAPFSENLAAESKLLNDFSSSLLQTLTKSPQTPPPNSPPTILFVSRDTPYRRVLNQDQIVALLQQHFTVNVVEMSAHNITTQLHLASQHHMLIGVHGAGLTHLLFLSKPAVVLELFDCGETSYRSLARLSGVHYMSIQRTHVQVHYNKHMISARATHGAGISPKEADFRIDPDVVLRTVREGYRAVFGARDEL